MTESLTLLERTRLPSSISSVWAVLTGKTIKFPPMTAKPMGDSGPEAGWRT